MVRVCFQVELAHWFYLDFYCTNNKKDASMKLKPCGMKEFSRHIFQVGIVLLIEKLIDKNVEKTLHKLSHRPHKLLTNKTLSYP